MSKDMKTYKTTLITDYYKSVQKINKVYGYNLKTDEWHCIVCGISMGRNNPRQLCGKTKCYYNC
jgi:rubrerythrin